MEQFKLKSIEELDLEFVNKINAPAAPVSEAKSDLIPEKSTRTAAGVQVMKLPRGKVKVDLVTDRIEDIGEDALKCKKLVLPSNGSLLSQLTFNF